MSHNTHHERRERIVELLNDDELTGYQIDTIIMDEFDCSRDAARKARKRVLAGGAEKKKVNSAEQDGDVGIINWETRQYDFVLINGHSADEFDIPFKEMQDYVHQYTYAGAGKTRAEVCRHAYAKYNRKLTTDYLRRIFKCLDIYKASIPFAPHMYEENSQEELVDSWRERDEAGVEAKYRSQEMRHIKSLLGRKTKELNRIQDFTVECIEEIEFSPLPEMKPIEVPAFVKGYKSVGDIQLGDWHYGLRVDEWYNAYDEKIAKLRVEEMLDKVAAFVTENGNRFESFNVCLLGDMIDGIHGDMHPDQHLEQTRRGVQQVVEASDLLVAAMRGLYSICGDRLRTVKAVAGNHGRDAKNSKGDPQRTPETLMYHLVQAKSQLDLEWTIATDNPVIEYVRYNKRFVLGHGDTTPKSLIKVATPRLRRGQHIVFYSGHKHEVRISGLYDANFTHVQNGCMCGSTPYAVEHLGYHAMPAQNIVEVTPDAVLPHPVFLLEHGCEVL